MFAGVSFAKETTPNPTSSTEVVRTIAWTADEKTYPDLQILAECHQKDAKHFQWDVTARSTKDWTIQIKDKGKALEIEPMGSVELTPVDVKSCEKPLQFKMDARRKGDNEHYALEYKDGKIVARDKQATDWSGWAMAFAMAGTTVMETQAANDAQLAQVRAQEQAAAQARALQQQQMRAAFLQERAAQEQANAAYEEQVQAQRAAQAAQQAQRAAQQAEAQQAAAQRAAGASQSARSTPVSNPGYGYSAPAASTPAAQPSDLSISQNYVDNYCNNGVTTAHYQLTNASYHNASVSMELDYQTGGVQTSFVDNRSVGPRSSNDYTREIQCGPETQLSDYGRSNIVGFQFH
jgi:DNA segregation ATPase FtsK/SpoIIIE-like protein